MFFGILSLVHIRALGGGITPPAVGLGNALVGLTGMSLKPEAQDLGRGLPLIGL